MRVVVVTPPPRIIPLAAAKFHLKQEDSDDDDMLIDMYLETAIGMLDGPAGSLGRALGVQTLEAYLDPPAAGVPLQLPYPPVVGIVSVESRDYAGTWSPVDPTLYELAGDDVAPFPGRGWPGFTTTPGTIRVRYNAGYDIVPAPIRAAILLMTGDLYRNRETVAAGKENSVTMVPMSTTVQNLLAPFRVWR